MISTGGSYFFLSIFDSFTHLPTLFRTSIGPKKALIKTEMAKIIRISNIINMTSPINIKYEHQAGFKNDLKSKSIIS